jgi:hypothetical protein
MSEQLYKPKDMTPISKITIEIDDPNDLIRLAEKLTYAADNSHLPGDITIRISENVEIRYKPFKSSIPFVSSNSREPLLGDDCDQ